MADLPFELDLPYQQPIILVDPPVDQEEDRDVTEPEITTVNVMEPWSSLVRIQGDETGGGQEPRALEVEEDEQEPIGMGLEEGAETSPVRDTDIAPED